MKIQPTQKYVLVRIVDQRKGEPKIFIPDSIAPLNPYGEVLAIGPAVTACSVGDKALFLPNGLIEMDQDGEKVHIINEGCILAVYV